MKLFEEFRLYETMWEAKATALKEAVTDTVVITAESLGEKIIVARKDLALAKKLDRKACDIWESAEERYYDEDELCDKLGIVEFSGVEIFSKLAEDTGLEFDLVEDEALNLKEFVSTHSNTSRALKWEDLLVEADKLLNELCIKSGNGSWDDGDGYWSGDEEWCNRNLYYIRLANVTQLEKLCAVYSEKLPNVEFYFFDDEDEEVSEIGYTAIRANELTENTVGAPIYSGNLRAYAYYGGTPKNQHNFKNTNPDVPYTDPDNLGSVPGDDYIFSGTREAWIKKLNKIAKHHQIVMLDIADEQEHEVFLAADTDPDTGEEYDDIIVFKNEIFKEYEPFMKQFIVNKKDSSARNSVKAPSKVSMYFITTYDGKRGQIYHFGTSLEANENIYNDCIAYGDVTLYEYTGDPALFNKLSTAGRESTRYSRSITELGFDMKDCQIIRHKENK